MLLHTLGASLLGYLLTGKGAIVKSPGWGIYRVEIGKGLVRAAYGNNKMDFKSTSSFNKLSKYKNIIKMNQDSMVFFSR